MESRAHLYYTQLATGENAERLKAVEDLTASGEERWEDDWLEFKVGDDLQSYLLGVRNKQTDGEQFNRAKNKLCEEWSKLISGFANNEGGVVVWGIHAKPEKDENGDSTDRAKKLLPFENVSRCRDALDSLAGTMTDPPLNGLQFTEVRKDEKCGYLVVYIPEGKVKPYICQHPKYKPTYFRFGDECKIAPLSIVRMLFQSKLAYRASVAVNYVDSLTSPYDEWELLLRNDEVTSIKKAVLILDSKGRSVSAIVLPSSLRHRLEGNGTAFYIDETLHVKRVLRIPFGMRLAHDIISSVTVTLLIDDYYPMSVEYPVNVRQKQSFFEPLRIEDGSEAKLE